LGFSFFVTFYVFFASWLSVGFRAHLNIALLHHIVSYVVVLLQSYLKPDQLELLKESCERAAMKQHQEIVNRLNIQLADDRVSSVIWFCKFVS